MSFVSNTQVSSAPVQQNDNASAADDDNTTVRGFEVN